MWFLLQKKFGWCLIILGALTVYLTLHWKMTESFSRYGGMIFGVGCMIVVRHHKSVFNWD